MLKKFKTECYLKHIKNVGRCMHVFSISDASVCSFDKHLQIAYENDPLISTKML